MLAKTLLAVSALALPISAATISWGSAFNFDSTDESLWLNNFDAGRNGGTAANGPVLSTEAVSYGNGSGRDPVINGLSFTEVAGSTDFWGNTGIDPDIDEVLSGHETIPTLTLSGLTIGNQYQIQLVGIHDNRGGIRERQYEVSFGGSDFTSGGTPEILTRAGYGNTEPPTPLSFDGFASNGTVVGTFVADATAQTIQIRPNQQDGNTGDDVDPGLSGYILLEQAAIPEPSSTALLGLAGLSALLRRRR